MSGASQTATHRSKPVLSWWQMLQLTIVLFAAFLGLAALPSGYTAANAAHHRAADAWQGSAQLSVASLVVQHTAPPERLAASSSASATGVSQRTAHDAVGCSAIELEPIAPSLLQVFVQSGARAIGQRCRLLFPFHFFW